MTGIERSTVKRIDEPGHNKFQFCHFTNCGTLGKQQNFSKPVNTVQGCGEFKQ